MLQQFKVFRALGLAFKAWFRNFLPFTLLAAILYAPVIAWVAMLPDTLSGDDLDTRYAAFVTYGPLVLAALAALLPSLLVFRVIEHMNGRRVSMLTSMRHGLRGIIPATLLAAISFGLEQLPLGGILAIILLCYWFVIAPAAVVERLGPIAAIKRTVQLTSGRRWPIFGMLLLIWLAQVIPILVLFAPLLADHQVDDASAHALHRIVVGVVVSVAVVELFKSIVQAASYALLRADKDGVSTEDLAKVFE